MTIANVKYAINGGVNDIASANWSSYDFIEVEAHDPNAAYMPARYGKLASAPTYTPIPMTCQDSSGQWWQIAESQLHPAMAGASMNIQTDDSAALNALTQFIAASPNLNSGSTGLMIDGKGQSIRIKQPWYITDCGVIGAYVLQNMMVCASNNDGNCPIAFDGAGSAGLIVGENFILNGLTSEPGYLNQTYGVTASLNTSLISATFSSYAGNVVTLSAAVPAGVFVGTIAYDATSTYMLGTVTAISGNTVTFGGGLMYPAHLTNGDTIEFLPNVLQFAASGFPTWVVPGMVAHDEFAPSALTGLKVATVNIVGSTVYVGLTGAISASIANSDPIFFQVQPPYLLGRVCRSQARNYVGAGNHDFRNLQYIGSAKEISLLAFSAEGTQYPTTQSNNSWGKMQVWDGLSCLLVSATSGKNLTVPFVPPWLTVGMICQSQMFPNALAGLTVVSFTNNVITLSGSVSQELFVGDTIYFIQPNLMSFNTLTVGSTDYIAKYSPSLAGLGNYLNPSALIRGTGTSTSTYTSNGAQLTLKVWDWNIPISSVYLPTNAATSAGSQSLPFASVPSFIQGGVHSPMIMHDMSLQIALTAAPSGSTLTFGSAVTATIVPGMTAWDVTAGVALAGTVQSISSNTVTFTAAIPSSVHNGDSILFGPDPLLGINVEGAISNEIYLTNGLPGPIGSGDNILFVNTTLFAPTSAATLTTGSTSAIASSVSGNTITFYAAPGIAVGVPAVDSNTDTFLGNVTAVSGALVTFSNTVPIGISGHTIVFSPANILTFASAAAVPPSVRTGMTLFDPNAPAALSGLVTVNIQGNTVVLSGNVSTNIASGDTIYFMCQLTSQGIAYNNIEVNSIFAYPWICFGMTAEDIAQPNLLNGLTVNFNSGVSIGFSANILNAVTNASTSTSSAVLHFASTPSWITTGMSLIDMNAQTALVGLTVLSTTSTTVTMSGNVAATVNSGDNIEPYPYTVGDQIIFAPGCATNYAQGICQQIESCIDQQYSRVNLRNSSPIGEIAVLAMNLTTNQLSLNPTSVLQAMPFRDGTAIYVDDWLGGLTAKATAQSVVLGQVTTLALSAAPSGYTLTFASVPSTVVAGMTAYDTTTSTALPGVVQSTTGTTVVMSSSIPGGVNSGNSITFGPVTQLFLNNVNGILPGMSAMDLNQLGTPLAGLSVLTVSPVSSVPSNFSTNASTPTSSNVLHCASVPSWVVAGTLLTDANVPAALVGLSVSSTTSTTIVLSGNVAAAVNSGDTIELLTLNPSSITLTGPAPTYGATGQLKVTGTITGNPQTLVFASVPAWVQSGMTVEDITTGSSLNPANPITVLQTTATTITFSAAPVGVSIGDTLSFFPSVVKIGDTVQFGAPNARYNIYYIKGASSPTPLSAINYNVYLYYDANLTQQVPLSLFAGFTSGNIRGHSGPILIISGAASAAFAEVTGYVCNYGSPFVIFDGSFSTSDSECAAWHFNLQHEANPMTSIQYLLPPTGTVEHIDHSFKLGCLNNSASIATVDVQSQGGLLNLTNFTLHLNYAPVYPSQGYFRNPQFIKPTNFELRVPFGWLMNPQSSFYSRGNMRVSMDDLGYTLDYENFKPWTPNLVFSTNRVMTVAQTPVGSNVLYVAVVPTWAKSVGLALQDISVIGSPTITPPLQGLTVVTWTANTIVLSGPVKSLVNVGDWISDSDTVVAPYPSTYGYWEIGKNMLRAHFRIQLSTLGTKGSGNPAQITGLPVPANLNQVYGNVDITYAAGFSGLAGGIVGQALSGSSNATLATWSSSGTQALTLSNMSSTSVLEGEASFMQPY